MSSIQIAGMLLVAGTLSFWLGAALPTWKAHMTTDPEVRAKLITERDSFWVVSHLLFLIGAIAVAAGLGLFTSTIEAPDARTLAVIGLFAHVLGTLVWGYIVLGFRLLMLPDEYVRTTGGAWTFPTYAVLTLGAHILYGIVLLQAGFPTWLGLVTIGANSLMLFAFLVGKLEAPPLFYITALPMGFILLT